MMRTTRRHFLTGAAALPFLRLARAEARTPGILTFGLSSYPPTLQPWAANCLASSQPRPLDAPVITATWFAKVMPTPVRFRPGRTSHAVLMGGTTVRLPLVRRLSFLAAEPRRRIRPVERGILVQSALGKGAALWHNRG